MTKEEKKQMCEGMLWEEGYLSVERHLDDGWRHGNYVTEVFQRESDSTYWRAFYQVTGDGEYNGLREGDVEIEQVRPETVTKTITETIYHKI